MMRLLGLVFLALLGFASGARAQVCQVPNIFVNGPGNLIDANQLNANFAALEACLKPATTTSLGLVQPDGTTIFVNGQGVISTTLGTHPVGGPTSSVVRNCAIWNNSTGTLLSDDSLPCFTPITFGAVPSAGDNTTAFQAADNAAAARGGALVQLPAGSWLLNGTVTSSDDNVWELLPGASLSGTGQFNWEGSSRGILRIPGLAGLTFARSMSLDSAEIGLYAEGTATGTTLGTTPSYEKDVARFSATQYTSSCYGPAVLPVGFNCSATKNFDLNGLATFGTIDGGTQFGRVWGFTSNAYVNSGSDGQAVAGEFDSYNSGSEMPYVANPRQKFSLNVVALGPNKVTALESLGGSANSAFYGIAMVDNVTSLYPFALFSNVGSDPITDPTTYHYTLDNTGLVTAHGLRFVNPPNAPSNMQLSTNGPDSVLWQDTVAGAISQTVWNPSTASGSIAQYILRTGAVPEDKIVNLGINESTAQSAINVSAGLTAGFQINVANGLVQIENLPTSPPSTIGAGYLCVDSNAHLYMKSSCP